VESVLMIRMAPVVYVFGIRLERRICAGAPSNFSDNEVENVISPRSTAKNPKLRRETMARNFGVPRQIDRRERMPIWPTWRVIFAIKLGIINPAKFPYHG
jgi:hypothetical protein